MVGLEGLRLKLMGDFLAFVRAGDSEGIQLGTP